MKETMRNSEALTPAQKNLLHYFQTQDVQYIAEDAVFKSLSTGQEYRGRAEIGAMLHFMYHVAFDAQAEIKSYIITDDKAQAEGFFKGRHIGEFMGIPATNRAVNVPLCVTYKVQNGLIQEARMYMLFDVLMQQLGVAGSGPRQKTTYLVRDIFQLKFGQYRQAKKLLDEALEKKLMPEAKQTRVLTDFTGHAYRLIFEEGFDTLQEYEASLAGSMRTNEWQQWYEQFKPLVERGHREILKQVL